MSSKNKSQHYDGSHNRSDSVKRFVPNTRDGELRPIRFENLRPGSFFVIFAEPSRKIRQSTDERVYQKAFDQFNAHHVSSPLGIVLYPNDLVVPCKLVPLAHD